MSGGENVGYTTKKLREYRMEQGLSMSELSYKAKITANQISLLEKQKIKRPQAATIRKLAERLQISLKRRKTKYE